MLKTTIVLICIVLFTSLNLVQADDLLTLNLGSFFTLAQGRENKAGEFIENRRDNRIGFSYQREFESRSFSIRYEKQDLGYKIKNPGSSNSVEAASDRLYFGVEEILNDKKFAYAKFETGLGYYHLNSSSFGHKPPFYVWLLRGAFGLRFNIAKNIIWYLEIGADYADYRYPLKINGMNISRGEYLSRFTMDTMIGIGLKI